MYLPLWGINYTSNPYYTPVKGCASRDFFVTYTLSTPYADVNTLRIGFQNTSSDSDRKMLIQPGQWLSGSVADANTGAVIFRVCNQ